MKNFKNELKLKKYLNNMEKKKKKKICNSEQSDFMNECISKVMKEGYKQDQAIAICYSKWREGKVIYEKRK